MTRTFTAFVSALLISSSALAFDSSAMESEDLWMAQHAIDNDVEVAPLWEAGRKNDGRDWTLHSLDVVKTYGANLMAGAKDVRQFCPRYQFLSENQKANFWVYLVSAMVKYESNFNPLTRYRESTLGIDSVTKKPVYSEGLLQLSYQDQRPYPFCNEFKWSSDKYLSAKNPRKTILSPYKNLKCGIRILDRIVGRKKYISFNSGHYWAVLTPKNQARARIAALTNRISFCQK